MARRINRRYFLQSSAAASAALLAGGVALGSERQGDKLRLGMIGTGGMGGGNHNGMIDAGAEIVAICDVDDQINEGASHKSPKAKKFNDFRKMLDECGKELDGVVVSIPDHTHAIAAVTAMKMGLHCYCEKPLAHDVYEVRVMRHVAATTKAKGGGELKTQMGNRGTAENGFRRGVELLRAGIIGPVKEIHIWSNRPIWPQGMTEPAPAMTPPPYLAWDLWLSTAPERPFSQANPRNKGAGPYHQFAWRGWWDFGTGALGDMACHTANQAFMGLKLGAVKAVESKTNGVTPQSPPKASTIVYEFGDRGEGFPAGKLIWYDGTPSGNMPPTEVTDKIKKFVKGRIPRSGAVYIGEKGVMFAPDDYATRYFLSPEGLNEDAKKIPVTLPRAHGGHYKEWVDACLGKIPKALSNFVDHAGPLAEFVLMGNIALRVGKRVEWDSEHLKSPNCPEAAQYVKREYRKGWELGASV